MPDPTQDATQDTGQIQGLPPGAVLKPIQQAPQVEGLPAGATLKPITQAAPVTQEQFNAMSPADQQAFMAKRHAVSEPEKTAARVINPEPTTWSNVEGRPGKAEELADSLAAGVGKGAAQTGKGLLDVAESAFPPVAAARGIGIKVPNISDKLVRAEDLKPENLAEHVGYIAENVLEFMSGEGALKGLSMAERFGLAQKVTKLAEESPTIAKLLRIGMNNVRLGTVGGAQTLLHGGTPTEALETGALTGATGTALEGTAEGAAALRRSVTGAKEAAEVGADLTKSLSGGEAQTPRVVAQTVNENLTKAEKAMHDTYDASFKTITEQAKGIPVPVAGSPLQAIAKELLGDSKVPAEMAEALKGVIPDSDKIEPFLKDLAESKKEYTWEEMEATRSAIGKTIRKLPYDSPIRPDLIKVRYAMDATFADAAEKAGNPDLAKSINQMHGEYAGKIHEFEENAITALRDKNPDSIADVLMGKSSAHNVETLRSLIGPENMQPVEGSLFERLLTRSMDVKKSDTLDGLKLRREFNKLGPDVKQAIWGDRLPDVEAFVGAAAKARQVEQFFKVARWTSTLGALAIYAGARGNLASSAKIGGAYAIAMALTYPPALKAVTTALTTPAVAKGIPAVAGAIARIQFQDSNGDTHEIPEDQLDKAREIDPGLKVLSDGGESKTVEVKADPKDQAPDKEMAPALTNAPTNPFPGQIPAGELNPEFRKQAQAAWEKAEKGNAHLEVAFAINPDGTPTELQVADDERPPVGSMAKTAGTAKSHVIQEYPEDARELVHTHNDYHGPLPSEGDKDAAKKAGKPIYVISSGGLFRVTPDRQFVQLHEGDNWMTPEKAAEQKKDEEEHYKMLQSEKIIPHKEEVATKKKTADKKEWDERYAKLVAKYGSGLGDKK